MKEESVEEEEHRETSASVCVGLGLKSSVSPIKLRCLGRTSTNLTAAEEGVEKEVCVGGERKKTVKIRKFNLFDNFPE